MEQDLPTGWCMAGLGEISTVIAGVGFPPKYQGETLGELPFVKVSDISAAAREQGALRTAANYISRSRASELKAHVVSPGSILFAKIGEAIRLNRRALTHCETVFDNNVFGVVPDIAIVHPEYLLYFLQTVDLYKIANATTVPSIRKSELVQLQVPLPPLDEQTRMIVAVRTARTRIQRVRRKLESISSDLNSLRESVLAAAFRGDLTADWRESARFAELFNLHSTTGSRKQGEPSDVLPDLPQGWGWVRIADLVERDRKVAYGVLKPGQHTPGGVRFIKSGQVRDGYLDLSEDFRISRELDAQYRKTRLKGGEVLLNLVGASIGRSSVATKGIAGANVTRAIAVLPIVEGWSDWVQAALQGPVGQRLVQSATGGSAQPVLNLAEVRNLAIPLPSVDERDEIMRRIRGAFQSIESLSEAIEFASARLGVLETAILTKAFRGELVPQDPNDEPASVLLERIRAEKAREGGTKPRRGRRAARR